MMKVVAINASPNQDKGGTGLILSPFLSGLKSHGAQVSLFYTSKLKIKPCSCGHLYCWYRAPGVCIHHDDMEEVYPLLKDADILVLATPVYTPLPGDLQNFINRMTPLINPDIEFRQDRTRARFREDVRIKKICLVAVGGWWELENLDTVVRITRELAAVVGVPFAGPILRPHVQYMWHDGKLSDEAHQILGSLEQAAEELIQSGEIKSHTLEVIRRPLVSQEAFFENWRKGQW